MARKHYWQFLVTDEGNPIENASISIYEAGSENPVWIFTDELGGSGTASTPQVTTSKKGFFEFWIATDVETNGYPISTKFRVAWSAPGVSGGYIDYIDVFSTAVEPVLIGDTNPDLNKAVSNALATGWENHKNWDVTVDGHPIHGIYGVDVGDTDPTLSKLVSNFYAKRWTDHESSNYDGTVNIFSPPTNPHGILEVDETITGDDRNKLISNTLAKTWNDHALNLIADPHPQYSLVDGTREYTGAVGYQNGVLLTVDNFSVDGDHAGGGVGSYPNVPLTGGGGSGAIGTVTVNAGSVVAVTVTSGGLGYRVPRRLSISAADIGGTGAQSATCNVATVSSVAPDNNLLGNEFITAAYIEATEATAIVNPVGTGQDGTMGADGVYYYDLVSEGGGEYSFVFEHDIGTIYPLVTVWRNVGLNSGEVVQPISIVSIDASNVKFTFNANDTFIVRIHGRL